MEKRDSIHPPRKVATKRQTLQSELRSLVNKMTERQNSVKLLFPF